MPLFFDASHLPAAGSEYVAWVDVMGTQSSMSRSINATANFIFKLHSAALQAPHTNLQLYPVMDGFYAASPSQQEMLSFLRTVFQSVAEEFNQSTNPLHRFVIRSGLAFGPVIHGIDIGAKASTVLANNQPYRDAILLGLPMVQAYLSESGAPPFGVLVHESARAFAPASSEPLHAMWWKWGNNSNQAIWTSLEQSLTKHLDWCSQRCMAIGYPAERVEAHKEMVRQYFAP